MEFSIHEDRLQTIAINSPAAGDTVLKAIGPGRLFIVTAIYLVCEGSVDVMFKSGATSITGAMPFGAANLPWWQYWSNGGDPIWRGRAAGDDLIINLSGAPPPHVHGWVSLLTIDARNV